MFTLPELNEIEKMERNEKIIAYVFVSVVAFFIIGLFLVRQARAVEYDNYFTINTTAGQLTSFDSADNTRTHFLAIRFTPATSGYVCNVQSKIGRLDYTTTTLKLSIYAQPSGNPYTGSLMVEKTISDVDVPYTGLGAPTNYVNFVLPGCYFFQNNKTYDLIYSGSETKAGSLHYGIAIRTSDQTALTESYSYVPVQGWQVVPDREYSVSMNGIRASELDQVSTSTSLGICDYTTGSVESALCDTVAYLFVPSNQSLAQWQDQLDEIKYKVPHGYLFLLSDEFTSSTASINTTTHLAININVPSMPQLATATLDITQAYNDTPSDIRDFGYLWLKRALWLLFISYVIYRGMNIFKNA